MDKQSPIQQIDRQQFCSGLDDEKRSREIKASKEALKQLFPQITCYRYIGSAYLSWMSKNWFCLALAFRISEDWGLLIGQKLDLVELAFRYPKQTEAILNMKISPDFKVPEKKNKSQMRKQMENHYCETFLFGQPGGQGSIYCDKGLKNYFISEKQQFQALYNERKLQNTVSFRLSKPKNCIRCKAPFNKVEKGLQVCSRQSCSVGKRKQFDISILPNLLFTAQIVGFKELSLEERMYFQNLQRMPVSKENNIKSSLGKYRYTNQIAWCGSLANRVLRIPIGVVPYSLATPILRAKNLEQTLPLEIRQVSYIKGVANRGVFATMALKENTVVCVYSGEMMRVSQSPFWQYNDSMVKFAWVDNDTISLVPRKFANVGRFFNGVTEGEKPNMVPLWTLVRTMPQQPPELVLLLITSMNVPAETELKWFYGGDFTKKML